MIIIILLSKFISCSHENADTSLHSDNIFRHTCTSVSASTSASASASASKSAALGMTLSHQAHQLLTFPEISLSSTLTFPSVDKPSLSSSHSSTHLPTLTILFTFFLNLYPPPTPSISCTSNPPPSQVRPPSQPPAASSPSTSCSTTLAAKQPPALPH